MGSSAILASTHFVPYRVPGNKFDVVILDGRDATLDFRSPGNIRVFIRACFQAVDQNARDLCAIRFR